MDSWHINLFSVTIMLENIGVKSADHSTSLSTEFLSGFPMDHKCYRTGIDFESETP